MIDELQVKNLALIKDAHIEFSPKMTVLTGETGAGKTALLSALKLLVGERAHSQDIREGSDALELSARIFLHKEQELELSALISDEHKQRQELFEYFDLGDDEECLIQRKQTSEGRSRCNINAQMAKASQLAILLGPELDLCGQHEHQSLLNVKRHRFFYDSWLGAPAHQSSQAYTKAYLAYKDSLAQIASFEEAMRSSKQQLEDARFALERIAEVDPQLGELEELQAQLPRYEHAESLAEHAAEAFNLLMDEDAVLDSLSAAVSEIDRACLMDEKLLSLKANLQEALVLAEDSAAELRQYKASLPFDPYELERLRSRLDALEALAKLYGPRMEDVLKLKEESAHLLASVDNADETQRLLDEQSKKALAHLQEQAQQFYALREASVKDFCTQVNAFLDRLEMKGAHLELKLELLDENLWTSQSPCMLEFMFKPSAHMSARSLARIASGGEISRLMLALKLVLSQADNRSTLVFDEIDAGVGGQAAQAIAELLAELARRQQVIVVTHLAQIAACADRHYLLSKLQDSSGEAHTELKLLSDTERIDELARMLSGASSPVARAHAQELLDKNKLS